MNGKKGRRGELDEPKSPIGSKSGRRGRGVDTKDAIDESEAEQLKETISKAPGADLLSPLEIGLCTRLPMLPLHFLAAKDAIVREAYRNGMLTDDGVRRVLKIDGSKAAMIFDFFVKDLHINEPPLYG